MDSLVGYGSDDDNEPERYEAAYNSSVGHHRSASQPRRRDDDGTNYDDVNMDMSEDSQAESEPELPPADPAPPRQHSYTRDEKNYSEGRSGPESRERERDTERRRDERDRRREHERGRRDRSDDRYARGERGEDRRAGSSSRRGLLGDRPGDDARSKVPSLMDMHVPTPSSAPAPAAGGRDARDAVTPRFVDRDRRDRERERDRDRHSRRSEEKRSSREGSKYSSDRRSRSRERERSKPRGAAFPPPPPLDAHANTSTPSSSSSCIERRGSPAGGAGGRDAGDYRPSSYKVNKKLEVMEKMGLQIKTPDGSMATAQQLRQAAHDAPPPAPRAHLPSYYNPAAINSNKILDQVNKRKLLWSNKGKSEAEEAAKWSGTRFANDDGKQVSKFMRLMGIKEPGAVKQEAPDKTADPIKKQEELFEAMQQQYEVARATTHTMRGVGLGFQRGQY